jgi:hypothetical protein
MDDLPAGLQGELRAMLTRANASVVGIVYSTTDAATELLKGAEAACDLVPELDHIAVELKAARERTEIARDMARRSVFAAGGAIVPRQN